MRRKLVGELGHATPACTANGMLGNSIDPVSGYRKVWHLFFAYQDRHPRHQQLPHNIKMVNRNHIKTHCPDSSVQISLILAPSSDLEIIESDVDVSSILQKSRIETQSNYFVLSPFSLRSHSKL